jgi:hypothetical protein
VSEIQNRKVSVTFERKLDVGSYQNVVARAWVEGNIGDDAGVAEVAEELQNLFSAAKAAVYDELGIEVLMDEAGVIREKHKPTVTVTEQRLGKELGATQVSGGGSFDTKGIECANANEIKEDFPQWLADKCNELGITKVWVKQGQYGQFYKEFVSKDAEPKLGYDDQGRTKIISKPKRD